MIDAEVTAKLADALARELLPLSTSRSLAVALLPVVREHGDLRAAEELKAAAWDYPDALNPGRSVQGWLLDRADDLSGETGR